VDEQPQQQPFLDRPVRSLLDLKIGTVLKAYGIYLAIGLVIGLIGIAILFSWSRGSESTLGEEGSISWAADAGETVTPAEYRSLKSDAGLDSVRRRFGEPATTGHNPFDAGRGSTQSCLGYRSSASESLFLFCFEGGRLVDKHHL
jgi:hypothetical protein